MLFIDASLVSLILILHLVERESGIVHAYVPKDAETDAIIVDQLVPLFFVNSIFTYVTPLLVQVMLYGNPTSHFSPPTGDVIEIGLVCPNIYPVINRIITSNAFTFIFAPII